MDYKGATAAKNEDWIDNTAYEDGKDEQLADDEPDAVVDVPNT